MKNWILSMAVGILLFPWPINALEYGPNNAAKENQGGSQEVLGLEETERCILEFEGRRFKAALEWGKKALSKDPKNVTALICVGSSYDELGEQQSAIEVFHQAEALAKDPPHLVTIYNRLGSIYRDLGKNQSSITYWLKLLEIAKASQNKRQQIIALVNLGELYSLMEQYEVSISHFRYAMGLGPSQEEKVVIYNAMGLAYIFSGDPKTALDYFNYAMEIEKDLGNTRGVGQSMLNIGNAQREMGLFKESEETLLKGLAILKGSNDLYWEATAYKYLGWLYVDMNKPTEAFKYLEMAVNRYIDAGAQEESKQVMSYIQGLKAKKP